MILNCDRGSIEVAVSHTPKRCHSLLRSTRSLSMIRLQRERRSTGHSVRPWRSDQGIDPGVNRIDSGRSSVDYTVLPK